MAVKTNDEFHAMQHQIEVGRRRGRQHEERVLVNMMEADEINADHQEGGSGAQGGAGQGRRRARRDRERGQDAPGDRRRMRGGARQDRRGDGQQGRGRNLPAHRQGARHRGGARRRRALHHLPGAPAPGGVRRSPQERIARAVRQLQPHPLLRRTRRHPRHPGT